MRYVIVTDLIPAERPFCACCGNALDDGYLHELETGLFYCPTFKCFDFHFKMAIAAIENHAREVS